MEVRSGFRTTGGDGRVLGPYRGRLMAVEAACHEVIRSGDGKESIMKAQVGDELVVKGRHVGDHDRECVII